MPVVYEGRPFPTKMALAEYLGLPYLTLTMRLRRTGAPLEDIKREHVSVSDTSIIFLVTSSEGRQRLACNREPRNITTFFRNQCGVR
jgi:hypothetical protein